MEQPNKWNTKEFSHIDKVMKVWVIMGNMNSISNMTIGHINISAMEKEYNK